MADNKVNSGLLEFSEDQKVFVALDAETSEVKKAVTIDGDGVETDIAGGGGGVTVEALNVTENGTYSEEGKAYSPVVVEVAGGASDFSTAEVTFVNIDQTTQPYIASATAIKDNMIKMDGGNVLLPVTITVPLYKGKNLLPVTCILQTDESTMPTTEGDIEFSIESMGFLVTGDGTIKAKGLISA